jgi:hypothetical protein
MHDATSTLASSPEIPPLQRLGAQCAGPGCETLVLGLTRFCDGCFADAAKTCAAQIEERLLWRGFEAGTPELRCALAGGSAAVRTNWFEHSTLLGTLSFAESCRLRGLTDAACLLVSMGGVVALANLPGTRRGTPVAPKRGTCDFRALPQAAAPDRHRTQRELRRRENEYQAACLAVMFLLLIGLMVIR